MYIDRQTVSSRVSKSKSTGKTTNENRYRVMSFSIIVSEARDRILYAEDSR